MHTACSCTLASLGIAFAACATSAPPPSAPQQPTTMHTPTRPAAADNPLLAPWTGPYGGVPPFDKVEVAHFEPALMAAMDEHRREIAAITDQQAPPTFDNTLAALERSGRTLDRVSRIFGIWRGNMATPEVQAVARAMSPRLAAYRDEVMQNAKLFARVRAVYEGAEAAGLDAEQRRLAWDYHKDFVRAGAALDDASKARLTEINQRLATLFTAFGQNVLADEQTYLFLDDERDLAGLPDSLVSGAAAAAEKAGKPGQWAIANTRSAMEPFLTWSTRPDLRQQVFERYIRRGDNGDAHDTKAIASEILSLRLERAKLLGFETHAHFRLAAVMAKTPDNAMALMMALWEPAVAQVEKDVAAMQALMDAAGDTRKLQAWDYRFYAEKLRKARYDFDDRQLQPYLQLERLREGMFWVAGELFDLAFAPVDDVPVFHPDVRVWRVTNKTSGAHVGLWYFDPYAREGKRSGAWMNAYRNQERFDGEIHTIVSNNSNFVKPAPGKPVLISWTDATTLFHEFGHALHGLCSDVRYPSLSGTSVARDYVEFPSQLLEHWLGTSEVLSRFALHHETGEPLPRELVDKVEAAANFNVGFDTVEYLAGALVDMMLHLETEQPIDVVAFEKQATTELGMPDEIVLRHRTPHFQHIFATDGYSAGYYSYLWSDALTADAWEAFEEGQGAYDPAVAKRLRDHVFSVGNTVDPAEGYRAFRGRDVDTGALMRKRGFAPGDPR